jgi:putative NADH-flavin reductase
MTSATSTKDNETTSTTNITTTTLVIGATGATGRWVVKLLLDQGQNVKVVVRSKQKVLSILQEMNQNGNDEDKSYTDRLSITEASILDLSDAEIQEQVKDCDAVVSCLGHTLDLKGIWGQPRKLVTEVTQRLTAAIVAQKRHTKKTKYLLMGSEGVANPNGQDDKRTFLDRAILVLLRLLVPPHPDNEAAAAHVHSLGTDNGTVEWVVIRPTDLIDGPPTGKFELFDKPTGSLFGAGVVTRSNVAQCMVEFILDPEKWAQHKFTMPVIHDISSLSDKPKSEL